MTTHLNEKEIIPLHNKKNHNGSNNVKKASWFFAFLLMSILNNKGALAISKESLKPVDVKNLIYTSDSYSQKNVTIDDIYLEKSKKQYFFDLFTMIKNKAEVVKA